MPYKKLPPRRATAANHESMVEAIQTELKDPTTVTLDMEVWDMRYSRPYIIEESIRNSDRVQVHVIWQNWRSVREDQRSYAILDAYERAFGADAAQRVIVALGVTPEEAKGLGIHD